MFGHMLLSKPVNCIELSDYTTTCECEFLVFLMRNSHDTTLIQYSFGATTRFMCS